MLSRPISVEGLLDIKIVMQSWVAIDVVLLVDVNSPTSFHGRQYDSILGSP